MSACNIPGPARVCIDVENPDMDGFEAYVAARGPMLLRLAVMLSGNREDADDLLQKARPATEVADASGSLADRAARWQALGTLPPTQRAVLVLRYDEDLSDKQIADVLHCRATTVRSNASRALRCLSEATDGRTKEAWHESARR